MNNVPDIASLCAQLASHLQTDPSSTTLQASLSSLNQSLNLDNAEHSQFRVLNKALSLMCFKAPEVLDAEAECLVDTIVSVLSSCVSCEVLRFQNEESLKVGSLISSQNCLKLVETFFGIAKKLEGHGTLKQTLLSAVLRVAVSASCYQNLFAFAPNLSLEPEDSKIASVSEFQYLFSEETLVRNHEIPLRLLLWYLDPLTLKNDISNILRELVDKPFIHLKKELHDRLTWRSTIICLVLSPVKFIEARNLLHSWFLMTGMASIMELQSKLVSSVLDVLAQPMLWSISMEVGSKLRFSDAYFPKDHHLVGMLSGPISGEIFLGLLHHIGGSFVTTQNTHPQENSTWIKMINHKSTWSTLMAFPAWFLFASVLLFLNKDGQSDFSVRCISSAIKTERTLDAEQCRAAAARYLAYSICPMSEAHSDGLVKSLIRMSESWTLKQFSSHKNKVTSGRFKSFRRPRLISDRKDDMDCKENNGLALRLWLKGFQDCHMKYLTDITKSKPKNNYIPQQDLFFRRIPLGIFIECTNLDEEGCELLLHYAAAGEILQAVETEEIQELNWTEDTAFAGASVVFDLCELVDIISSSIFETDESGFRFVSQLKRKAVRFMVKCIRKLNGLTVSADGGKKSTFIDFRSRLEEWCYEGGELIQGMEPLNDALSALKF